MSTPERTSPFPDQESVWDYPRPPVVEPVSDRIRVIFTGVLIAQTARAFRVLETSHPPTIYIPPDDIRPGALRATKRRSHCEWKGQARYFDVLANSMRAEGAAWSYAKPSPGYEAIKGYVAFYPQLMDACFIGEDEVQPQEGDFYGGWITRRITGPFKGPAGTWN